MSDTVLLPTEEIRVDRLGVGDVLVMGEGEYPIRKIERLTNTVRLHLARMDLGVIREDYGSMLFEAAHTVRRLRR